MLSCQSGTYSNTLSKIYKTRTKKKKYRNELFLHIFLNRNTNFDNRHQSHYVLGTFRPYRGAGRRYVHPLRCQFVSDEEHADYYLFPFQETLADQGHGMEVHMRFYFITRMKI